MDILGIGPLELLFIFLIVLIVLGPNDMVKAGATLGRYLRRLMMSPTWRSVQETSRRIRYLPSTLARQAGLEEFQRELDEQLDLPNISGFRENPAKDPSLGAWTSYPEGGTGEEPPETDAPDITPESTPPSDPS